MKTTLTVTVCQLQTGQGNFETEWQELVAHVRANRSDLILLPELALSAWFAGDQKFDPAVWEATCARHQAWLPRLAELAPAVVLGTLATEIEGHRQNLAFAWNAQSGFQPAHTKYYLPDEPGFWEASWYARGEGSFNPLDTPAGKVGFLVCSEMWFFQHARAYAMAGVDLVAVPRCTPTETLDKWLAGGRACAVVAGAYCLSSNHAAPQFGGMGWIIDPDGRVLGLTSPPEPFVSLEIDLARARAAKSTYPRYIPD